MMIALSVLRRWVTLACGASFVLLAVGEFLMMVLGHDWSVVSLVKELVMVALGSGLLLGNAFARRATALVLLLVAVVLPLGYMNPFNASDMIAEQGAAPSVADILLWMVPLETLLIFVVWAVDPLKRKASSAPGAGDAKS